MNKKTPEREQEIIRKVDVLSIALIKLKREIEQEPFSAERVAFLIEVIKILS